jgi:hypothetical protein
LEKLEESIHPIEWGNTPNFGGLTAADAHGRRAARICTRRRSKKLTPVNFTPRFRHRSFSEGPPTRRNVARRINNIERAFDPPIGARGLKSGVCTALVPVLRPQTLFASPSISQKTAAPGRTPAGLPWPNLTALPRSPRGNAANRRGRYWHAYLLRRAAKAETRRWALARNCACWLEFCIRAVIALSLK